MSVTNVLAQLQKMAAPDDAKKKRKAMAAKVAQALALAHEVEQELEAMSAAAENEEGMQYTDMAPNKTRYTRSLELVGDALANLFKAKQLLS